MIRQETGTKHSGKIVPGAAAIHACSLHKENVKGAPHLGRAEQKNRSQ